jgi:cell division protein FtsB
MDTAMQGGGGQKKMIIALLGIGVGMAGILYRYKKATDRISALEQENAELRKDKQWLEAEIMQLRR